MKSGRSERKLARHSLYNLTIVDTCQVVNDNPLEDIDPMAAAHVEDPRVAYARMPIVQCTTAAPPKAQVRAQPHELAHASRLLPDAQDAQSAAHGTECVGARAELLC